MKNKKLRNFASEVVVRNRRETCARREKLALELRRAVALRLGDAATDPITSTLIDSVVSAALEINETTSRYILGHATVQQMQRLSIVRGSLVRSLRALNLIAGNAVEPEDAPPAPMGLTVEQVAADIILARRPAETGVADVMESSAS